MSTIFAYNVEKIRVNISTVVKVVSLEEKEALEALDVGAIIDSKQEVAHILADEAKLCRIWMLGVVSNCDHNDR